MPTKKTAPPDVIPPIAEDVAAMKDLLLWMRANHFAPQGAVIVARVSLSGVVDEHPRRLLEQAGKASLPTPDDESDDMDAFRDH